jgi:integrase
VKLLEHFSPDTDLDSTTEGHAIEFRSFLLTRDHARIKRAGKLSEATIRRRCGCIRQMFDDTVALELIPKNAFRSKRIPTTLPKTRQNAVVSPDMATRIADSLPDQQWRLLFALARWGGLRVPSEPRLLRWPDVDWQQMRLTVHSPKTEPHDDHGSRSATKRRSRRRTTCRSRTSTSHERCIRRRSTTPHQPATGRKPTQPRARETRNCRTVRRCAG